MRYSVTSNHIILALIVGFLCVQSVSAQRSAGGSYSASPPVGNMAPGAMQVLTAIPVQGLTLKMSIGEAIATLEAQSYGFELEKSQQMIRGSAVATYTFFKGTVKSNGRPREQVLLHVLMDSRNDPRRPSTFKPDWPVMGIGYVLQDRDNTARVKGSSGYDWTGTPEQALTDKARGIVCPALTADGFACRETDFGFTTDLLQDGVRGGALASFSGAGDGTYKVTLRAERLE